MKKILVITIVSCFSIASFAQNRIQHNGQDIFLSGMNLAWINFANDLTDFDETAFTNALDEISAAGGNCIRWWLHTNGASSPYFMNDSVSFITDDELLALYKGLDIAYDRGMGIIMCLWSFDMLRSSNSGEIKNRNVLMLTDTVYMQAYINNALIPILEIVGDHPAVICWEIFNEPEGMTPVGNWEDVDDVPITAVQTFINRTAGVIHRHTSGAKVSNGCWSFLAGTDVDGNHNYYTDERLIAQGGDPDGYLDFYMVHYYDWGGTAISPFHHPASYWDLDKPLVIGEFAANGPFSGIITQAAYDSLYSNGYAGGLAWQYAGDEFGGLTAAEPGLNYLAANFPSDIIINYPPVEYNNYPYTIQEIPDTILEMGSTLPGPYINLKEIFRDTEDSVSLTYFVSFNTNPALVHASVDIDTNLVLELEPGASGIAEIHIRAKDSQNKFASEKFRISVFDPDSPNKNLYRKVWASTTESSLLIPEYAVDGSMTSRWSSLYNDNQWLAVDMIYEYTLESVVLEWETAYGLDYEIQVATDTNNWQTVYHQPAGNGGKDIVLFAPVNCRYVRMNGIGRGTQWGFSLYEFAAYEDTVIDNIHAPITDGSNLLIYPVPFHESFTVRSTDKYPVHRIEIYNLQGTRIESFDYSSEVRETRINLSGIVPGMYYVVIHSGNTIAVKKVLKN